MRGTRAKLVPIRPERHRGNFPAITTYFDAGNFGTARLDRAFSRDRWRGQQMGAESENGHEGLSHDERLRRHRRHARHALQQAGRTESAAIRTNWLNIASRWPAANCCLRVRESFFYVEEGSGWAQQRKGAGLEGQAQDARRWNRPSLKLNPIAAAPKNCARWRKA